MRGRRPSRPSGLSSSLGRHWIGFPALAASARRRNRRRRRSRCAACARRSRSVARSWSRSATRWRSSSISWRSTRSTWIIRQNLSAARPSVRPARPPCRSWPGAAPARTACPDTLRRPRTSPRPGPSSRLQLRRATPQRTAWKRRAALPPQRAPSRAVRALLRRSAVGSGARRGSGFCQVARMAKWAAAATTWAPRRSASRASSRPGTLPAAPPA
mmetsp:Transcript_20719/g.57324  ORF Transcript_20719/g.57324 Transcript_20719/m.57324 type:complete len:215 (+) Transcript_20719:2029-2673(+)